MHPLEKERILSYGAPRTQRKPEFDTARRKDDYPLDGLQEKVALPLLVKKGKGPLLLQNRR